MPVRVVVADDHSLVREGLRRSLGESGDIEIVAETASGEAAVEMVDRHKPDVALLDIRMPGMNGIQAAGRIAERFPDVSVVMLTGHEESAHVVEAVRAGAKGFLLKTRDPETIARAVKRVAAGGTVIDQDMVPALAEEVTQSRPPREGLSSRETEILTHLADGLTNKQIGAVLFISADTVKTHIEHICQKLGTSDRTSSVAEALRRGLIA